MIAPTALEQYMLEFVNRARAQTGLAPLAFNGDLNEAAERHSKWMLDKDKFSHTGAGGSDPGDRMGAAGYQFTGTWTWGENVAWVSTRSPKGLKDEVQLLHKNLMNSPDHRANILSASYREVGIGLVMGNYKGDSSAFVTQNFARSGSNAFLTGVAFDDKDGDRFYDPGEGLGGVSILAVSTTGARYTMSTYGSGGYALALPAGTYTVTFSGVSIKSAVKVVSIGSTNVDLDLIDPLLAAASGTKASASTSATSEDDAITEKSVDGPAGSGGDVGSRQNDRLTGDDGPNVFSSGRGNDRISGNGGNDILSGEDGNDRISGGAGNDTITGGRGNDLLAGGTEDDIFVFGTYAADASRAGGRWDWSKDTILDFEQGADARTGDKIDLTTLNLTADARTELLSDIRYSEDKAVIYTEFGRIHVKGFAGTLTETDFMF